MLGLEAVSILLLLSKHILQGSFKTKPWLKPGFGGVLRNGGGGFRVVEIGDPCKEGHKSVNVVTEAPVSWCGQRVPRPQQKESPPVISSQPFKWTRCFKGRCRQESPGHQCWIEVTLEGRQETLERAGVRRLTRASVQGGRWTLHFLALVQLPSSSLKSFPEAWEIQKSPQAWSQPRNDWRK